MSRISAIGFLDGAVGIALTLLGAQSAANPGWDVALALSLPSRLGLEEPQ